MKTSEVINRAADLVEERGWTQGKGWHDSDSGLCLEGAIGAALGLADEQRMRFYGCPAHDAVADYLGRNPTPRVAPIMDALWQWNDALGRTVEEVIAVLRATALIEAAKENAEVREPAEVTA